MLLSVSTKTDSFLQFLTVLFLFVFVVFITWFATRWIAKIQKGQMVDGCNIEVIETQRISPNKYLQIVRAGKKYVLIAIGKDEVTMLTEIAQEDLLIKGDDGSQNISFTSVFEKVKNLNKKKED